MGGWPGMRLGTSYVSEIVMPIVTVSRTRALRISNRVSPRTNGAAGSRVGALVGLGAAHELGDHPGHLAHRRQVRAALVEDSLAVGQAGTDRGEEGATGGPLERWARPPRWRGAGDASGSGDGQHRLEPGGQLGLALSLELVKGLRQPRVDGGQALAVDRDELAGGLGHRLGRGQADEPLLERRGDHGLDARRDGR